MRKIAVFLTILFCVISVFVQAQVKSISGKVVNEKGQPVPFVSIHVKGTNQGISSDADGDFSIKASAGQILEISGIGISSKEITVGSSNTLSIAVTSKEANLTEVVVTALGVKRQARQLGYATSKINTDELTQAKVTNVGAGLAAKVSGLQVNLVNNGVKPDLRITLRGDRSILGNNQALLVVDDIQLPITYLATINPDDVDNVTVLKGASASALYGSAASNGVIILTTKRGKNGKPQIKLSSTVTVESVAYTPDFQNSFGQYGGEPIGFDGGAAILLPGNPYVPYVPFENQNYGPRFNGQRVALGLPITIFNADGTTSQKQDSINYSAIPNAKKDFFNNGVTTQNEVSYSAGDDKSKFYLSFQDVNAAGIIPKDVSRRDAIRLNGSRETGKFRADYNLGYTITHTNTTAGDGVPFKWGTTGISGFYGPSSFANILPGVNGIASGGSYFQNRALFWDIINQPADVDLRNYKNWQTNPFASPDGYFNAYYGNPWWQIDQTRLNENNSDILGNISLTLKPWNWLVLQYKAGIARDDYSNKYTQAGYTFASWAVNDPAYATAGYIPSAVKTFSPSEGDAMSFNQRLSSDFLASAHKTFGDFDARLIAGTSYIDNTIGLIGDAAATLIIPNFYNLSNRLGSPVAGQYQEETRTLGFFGDLTLGYKEYLFLHGSIRNDVTSLLSAANNSYLYPAVDAAFVFTDGIKSLKDNKVLSFGKIRAAYSQTAQVSIGAYSLKNNFQTSGGFPYPSTAGYTLSDVFANPDIKPEISTNTELGLDLGFLKSRINLSAAVYKTDTKDQTIQIATSAATGYDFAYVNSGVMQNKGIEIELKVTPIQSKSGFRWDIGANYSYNKNTVVSLGYGLNSVTLPNADVVDINANNGLPFNSVAVVGQAYGQIQTNDWERDSKGRIVVDQNTGMPVLGSALKYFGTSVAPTTIGFTTSLSYKGFTLNAVVDGRFGAVIFNGIGPALDFTGVSAYSASSGRQPFVIPNSVYVNSNGDSVANKGVTTSTGNNGFWANTWNQAGSNYVNSADFWKLRELSLSYTFPQSVLKHLKIVNAITIGVTGRNLLTWRAKDNIWSDPEFANTNGNASGNTDINQLPPTKFVGANLSVTF